MNTETAQILPQLTDAELSAAAGSMDPMFKAWDHLRCIKPTILDLTLRESAVGTPYGPVLKNKQDLLRLARSMGFRDILLGTFDVSLTSPDQVDDAFCSQLKLHGEDLTGCFAFTGIGETVNGSFVPDRSMQKLGEYGIPNTIVDLAISIENLPKEKREDFARDLIRSIQWFNSNIHGDHGGKPRIYINYQDLPDAFFEDWEWVAQLTKLLASQPVEAVTFEDGRGTTFPFQVAAMTSLIRRLMAPGQLLLAHMHAGSGMENANLIEAMLNGADGIWAGLAREGPGIGHAPASEFLANILRTGNTTIGGTFNLAGLLPTVQEVTRINTGRQIPDTFPIIGSNAYRTMLSAFIQKEGRAMDLPPEKIGGTQRYRIAPVVSDNAIIAGRLSEAARQLKFTLAVDPPPQALLTRMRQIMRQDLLSTKQIEYDVPENLIDLYKRASVPAS